MNGTYSEGTISVGAGSTTVTGVGTQWVSNGVREDDVLTVNGLIAFVASVDSETSLTLTRGWPGGGLTSANYDIMPIDDAQRSLATFNAVRVALGSGSLQSLAALSASADEMPYWTGQGVMGKTALTAAARDLLGQPTIVTQAADDATADRLTKVGDFGLGNTGTGIILGDLDAIDTPEGTYITNAGTTGSRPYTNAILAIKRRVADSLVQTLYPTTPAGAAGKIYTRIYVAGAWTSWRRGFTEGGSTANGSYTKFEDGTMICRHQLAVSDTGTPQWDFPQTFASAPTISASVLSAGSRHATHTLTSTTKVDLYVWDSGGVRRQNLVDVIAYGEYA